MWETQSVWNAPSGNVVMDQVKVKTVSKGSSGTSVKILQNALLEIGRGLNIKKSGGADGQFGNNTKKDVVEFQSLMDLEADGVAGSKTWSALGRAQNAQRETAFPPQNLVAYVVSGSAITPKSPTTTSNLAPIATTKPPTPKTWILIPIGLAVIGVIAAFVFRRRKGKRK